MRSRQVRRALQFREHEAPGKLSGEFSQSAEGCSYSCQINYFLLGRPLSCFPGPHPPPAPPENPQPSLALALIFPLGDYKAQRHRNPHQGREGVAGGRWIDI